MVTSEGPIATAVAGPDPTAFERWERDQKLRADGGEPANDDLPEVDEFVQLPVLDERVEHFEDSNQQWMVLFPEDFDNLMIDEPGNLALLIDEEQAREINRLTVKAIEQFEEGPDDEVR